jgi:uncharacterized membrane protein YgdD (TMEM256/DUF423 family)
MPSLMSKRILITASLFGATAVILGAFGAHSSKNLIDGSAIAIWTKGVEYQFYHTFALLFLYLIGRGYESKLIGLAYVFFTSGILLFSGSLYLLATRSILNMGFADYIGPITPIGGLMFICGWASLLIAGVRKGNA